MQGLPGFCLELPQGDLVLLWKPTGRYVSYLAVPWLLPGLGKYRPTSRYVLDRSIPRPPWSSPGYPQALSSARQDEPAEPLLHSVFRKLPFMLQQLCSSMHARASHRALVLSCTLRRAYICARLIRMTARSCHDCQCIACSCLTSIACAIPCMHETDKA